MSNGTLVPRTLRSRAWLGATLVSALALTPALVRAQTPRFDRAAVERRLTDAETRQDWAAALEAAQTLNERAEEAHLEALYQVARFQARLGQADRACESGRVDTVMMVDTLHYVKDRVAYARTLRAALAPGGRVVVIDFRPKPLEERPWGPPPEQKMPVEEVDAAMAAAGLVRTAVHDFLTEQFFVEYRAAERAPVSP